MALQQPMAAALLLAPLVEALEAWAAAPGDAGADAVAGAVDRLGRAMGVAGGELVATAPPIPELEVTFGDPIAPGAAAEHAILESPGDGQRLGDLHGHGVPGMTEVFAHAVALVLDLTRARVQARRAGRQLRALDTAVRGIIGVLELDSVLQLIVDRVRELADAQYAALGIVDDAGRIEQFVTSGIGDAERAAIGELPRGHGLLGLIIRENRPYRIPSIAEHPESHGFPPNHPAMDSFLGTPITIQGRAVGRLYLTNKVGAAEFTDEDQRLVEMFALHAGIAMENARLHAQVQRLAVVDERERISKDLHDSIIQSIYAVTLSLEDIEERIAADPAAAAADVDRAIDALHGVTRDIRNFIFGLRPILLDAGETLGDGLRALAQELRRNTAVEVAVEVDPQIDGRLGIHTTVELLTIAREALSNVARHAGASHARVRAAALDGALRLEVRDDGAGFDMGDVGAGHQGLSNIRTRAAALHGTLEVEARPGAGTGIVVIVPREPEAEPA